MVARGVYVAKEDGLQFDHSSIDPTTSVGQTTAMNADQYFVQFRCVQYMERECKSSVREVGHECV